MNKRKRKLFTKIGKGVVQDALNGTQAPQTAGQFMLTGAQGLASTSLGYKPVGSAIPMGQLPSSVPGVTATLEGGESPLLLNAEVGGALDLTQQAAMKQMKKKLRRAIRKNANNNGDISSQEMEDGISSEQDADQVQAAGGAVQAKYINKQLKKARQDPFEAIGRLESLAQQLKPQHPARLRAAGVLLKAKLVAQHVGSTGGLAKAAADIDTTAIVSAMNECEIVLGSGASSVPWQPQQIDARQQLQRIMNGGQPENLRGTQSPGSLTGYTSPTAALGAVLKTSRVGEELQQVEQQLRKAEANGDSASLSRLQERATFLKLKAHHMVNGGN